jgi:predicted molibdopterin-dependent oxidoreductase YjgC
MTREKAFTITIDNQHVDVKQGLTILEAARRHNIYIPSLCALDRLPSYGACRMCIVEVDGLRGFPTACTTPVEEGMVVRTESAEIRALRQEILRLVLSEHPASCLFCGEQEECKRFQGTIRKVGMTTGCRYCPNDDQCELQQITEKVGLTDISYPIRYRNFSVEKDDPFYDRDYNLCVLCGRCVRICNTVRMNGTLSFKQRGKLTTIGPAFDRSHVEGGCEFCGACLSVCPTGTLSAKTSKWYGKPEGETGTTCPYCSIGCRLMVQVLHDQVIDVLPDYASPLDNGLLCVKGRFGVPELVNSAQRFTEPRMLTPMGYEVVSWERAMDAAREKLSDTPPEAFLMLLSPQLSNEDLFVAQQFSRLVMGAENMASALALGLGSSLPSFLELACSSDGLDAIDKAEAILTLGFDSRYGYSPIGVRVKKAVEKGARLFTVSDTDTNLDMLADAVFKVESSQWADLLAMLLSRESKGLSALFTHFRDEADGARAALAGSSYKVMIAGPEALLAPQKSEILGVLGEIRHSHGWRIVAAHPFTNLSGMVAMGALPGIKPGEAVRKNGPETHGASPAVSIKPLDIQRHWRVVYIIGEACPDWLPPHDFLIYQNALPALSTFRPDLILPSALFTESAGTMFNVEGRLMVVAKAVEPPGGAKPDWWIMSRIAEALGRCKMGYGAVSAVQSEIRKHFKSFPEMKKRIAFTAFAWDEGHEPKVSRPAGHVEEANEEHPFLLHCKPEPDAYRGLPLAEAVPGMKRIQPVRLRRNNE